MRPIAAAQTATWLGHEAGSGRTGPRNTVRALIRLGPGGVLLPTAKLTFTTASGEPVSEVVLTWDDAKAEEAGLRAILDALRIARRYRPRHLIIYIDDESAAAIASGRERAPASLIGLALQVRALLHTYSSVEVRSGLSAIAPTFLEFRPLPGAEDPWGVTAG